MVILSEGSRRATSRHRVSGVRQTAAHRTDVLPETGFVAGDAGPLAALLCLGGLALSAAGGRVINRG